MTAVHLILRSIIGLYTFSSINVLISSGEKKTNNFVSLHMQRSLPILFTVHVLELGLETITQPNTTVTILHNNPSRDKLRKGTALTILAVYNTGFTYCVNTHFYNMFF